MRFFTYTTTIFLFIFTVGFTFVHAQIPVNDFAELTANTTSARPLQKVTLTVQSYSTDLHRATIAWYVNKKLTDQGTGHTTFTFTTGQSGSVTTVEAVIKTYEGMTITKSMTFKPAEVDLVWEADGITPPFYKGRPLFTHQGNLKMIAIPNLINKSGKRVSPSNLIYTWKLDFKVLGSASGYGKQRLDLKGGVLAKEMVVGVLVTDPSDNELHAETTLTLDAIEPEIVFYEDNPLYGVMYNKAIPDRYKLQSDEVKFVSVPYFFSNASKDALTYTWSINNLERQDLANVTSLTLRPAANSQGSSGVGLEIKNLRDIFQTARASFSVDYGKNTQQ